MIEVVFFDVGDTLVSQGAWVPGAKTCVARVREAGLRVGLVSNTGTLSRAELGDLLPPDFDLGEFEDSLLSLSSELGVEKPALSSSGGLKLTWIVTRLAFPSPSLEAAATPQARGVVPTYWGIQDFQR